MLQIIIYRDVDLQQMNITIQRDPGVLTWYFEEDAADCIRSYWYPLLHKHPELFVLPISDGTLYHLESLLNNWCAEAYQKCHCEIQLISGDRKWEYCY